LSSDSKYGELSSQKQIIASLFTFFTFVAIISPFLMKPNAISLANFFVDKALTERVSIFQLGLMKRVYITHGFCLAIYDKPALDSRFDVVEAWRYGPVIPSVYHSFKHHGKNPITEKSVIIDVDPRTYEISVITPELEDEDVIDVAKAVWQRYAGFSDGRMVELTHREGTPWGMCYEPGKTCEIPDLYTQAFYKKLIKK
jgi:uncharacterized phage-associated protein